MEPPGTTLTAFFELCATDETARDLLYADVPWRFRYHKKAWQIRKLQRGANTIDRICGIVRNCCRTRNKTFYCSHGYS